MSAIVPNARNLVSAQEIAARLHISPSTARRLAAEGALPAFRVGRQYRFDPDELLGHRPIAHPASPNRGERGI